MYPYQVGADSLLPGLVLYLHLTKFVHVLEYRSRNKNGFEIFSKGEVSQSKSTTLVVERYLVLVA
jgi:hypothetical protein